MSPRCFIFCTDSAIAEPISQVLSGLGIEDEYGTEAIAAVERVASETFQLIVVDWDQQPEAIFILQTARERKAGERPLTLAIVSDDASVQKAMQAGANSILRKPIQINQVKDTLTTARDMVRARQSAGKAMQAAAASTVAAPPAPAAPPALPEFSVSEPEEETPHVGGFVKSSASGTSTLFEAESEMQASIQQSEAQELTPLKNLEPVASALVKEQYAEPPPPPSSNEPRGLQWYLNKRAAAAPAPAPAPAPPPEATRQEEPGKPDMVGFDQTATEWKDTDSNSLSAEPAPSEHQEHREQKAEAELFAYIESDKPKKKEPRQPIRLGKGPILTALALAACAVVGAPQAPWHPQIRSLWGRGQKTLHAWLNPQLVTPAQAPATHENFGRAGDEYKLPVAENIPDATTDPSQIRVTPMVDPTKKPNNGAGTDPNLLPPTATGDQVVATTPNSGDASQTPAGQTPAQGQGQGQSPQGQSVPPADNPSQNGQPVPNSSVAAPPSGPAAGTASTAPVVVANAAPPHVDQPAAASSASASVSSGSTSTSVAPVQPAAPKNSTASTPQSSSAPSIPSSLKSQMASMAPDASGNKAPETALPSIEPVNVPEAAERALVTDQPAPAYPPNAKVQTGTVVLQILVGRDGGVEDAKFLQGSLAFARAAIDGVKQWKFKPYIMNGRPVSVQTNLTISFKPVQ
jgi:TonB family protein